MTNSVTPEISSKRSLLDDIKEGTYSLSSLFHSCEFPSLSNYLSRTLEEAPFILKFLCEYKVLDTKYKVSELGYRLSNSKFKYAKDV